MGERDSTRRSGRSLRRRLGRRECLLKGCERSFRPGRWDQRRCGEESCTEAFRRWEEWKAVSPTPGPRARVRYGVRTCGGGDCGQPFERRSPNQRYCESCRRAVSRQQGKRRKQRQRAEEKARRSASAGVEAKEPSPRGVVAASVDPAEASEASGHASVEGPSRPRICDRPGCYEAPLEQAGQRASYCGPSCARAVRRVLDRERKWRSRGTRVGRLKRRLQARRTAFPAGGGGRSRSARRTGGRAPPG